METKGTQSVTKSSLYPNVMGVRCWGHGCDAVIYLDGHEYHNADGSPHTCNPK